MTIAGALTRSLEDPQVPISDASLATWLAGGRTKAGTLVSEARVLGLPTYYRAMAIRSGVEAALPLKVYKRGTRQRIGIRTVLDSPNPGQKPFGFWQTMRMNSIGWGNAFARMDRNGADIVTRVWPIHPSRMRAEACAVSDATPDGKIFIGIDNKGMEVRFTSREIFHIPFMSPDGIMGVSAFRAFRDSLGIAIAAEDAAGSLFANGSRLAGILSSKQKLTKESADRLKQRWRERHSGPDSTGDIAVLDGDTTFAPIAIPPQDAELLLSRQWSVSEIGRMVGVPPHMIGNVDKTTSWGTGIEQQFIGWVQTTVYPELKNIEELVTAALLPGGWDHGSWYAEFDLNGLLRGDSAARASFYGSAIQWGWMCGNEVRDRENLERVDGLDTYLTPSNMTLVSVNGQAVNLDNSVAAPVPGEDVTSAA